MRKFNKIPFVSKKLLPENIRRTEIKCNFDLHFFSALYVFGNWYRPRYAKHVEIKHIIYCFLDFLPIYLKDLDKINEFKKILEKGIVIMRKDVISRVTSFGIINKEGKVERPRSKKVSLML